MTSMTRRRVLAATGALTVGTTALTTGASADVDGDGMVVFVYDDSPIEDYTSTYPIHQEYDVPGCVAACPGLMAASDEFMDPDQLTEMYEDGWEVMSHTIDHRALGHTPLERDAESGDDRLYVGSNLHGDHPGDPLVVLDGDREIEATVAGQGVDGDDHYVELESGLEESIEATDETVVRYTEEFTREILEESKAMIEEWGVPVTGFVYTYDRYHGIVEELVPEYYETTPNYRSHDGINPLDAIDPFQLYRRYIETDWATTDEIEQFMATTAEEGHLGIVSGHSQFETLPADRIEFTIEAALEHDLRIVTLQEALEELGHLEVHDVDVDDGDDSDDGEAADDGSENATESDDGGTNSTADDASDGMPGFGAAVGAAGVAGGAALAARKLASRGDDRER
ncbi:polysaccharide deacetylase family protein [Natrononativus amylolyticus]|uniref:polysaccharide deacetylase family protein n=1 Tax=Natrononativus amylolyticus TaxID=2963434 RepID=UPI0020CB6F04|nr:polysaccharide deacetylase family protein [Natrononativus amylolyticus]